MDKEPLDKHFKSVPASSIQPVKLETAVGINLELLSQQLDTVWQYKGQKQFDTYQTGKLIGTSAQRTTIGGLLNDVAKLVEEGIRATNNKTGITSENLKDHFIMLQSIMKVIASDLSALYAQQSHENTLNKEIDANDLLAILSGYVTTKSYAKQQN